MLGVMNVVNGFETLLAWTLYLKEPWYITRSEFDPENYKFNVHVGIRKVAAFKCPRCGSPTVHYGYEPTERSWRHVDCLYIPCYVYSRRPRVKCKNCGVQQVSAPFERKYSRCTEWFEFQANNTMEKVSRQKASILLGCNEKTLASIYSHRK